jgi:hypothetical protein
MTLVAAFVTVTTWSSDVELSTATIAVMSFVRLAGARVVSGSRCHNTIRVSRSTRYAAWA